MNLTSKISICIIIYIIAILIFLFFFILLVRIVLFQFFALLLFLFLLLLCSLFIFNLFLLSFLSLPNDLCNPLFFLFLLSLLFLLFFSFIPLFFFFPNLSKGLIRVFHSISVFGNILEFSTACKESHLIRIGIEFRDIMDIGFNTPLFIEIL